LGASFCDLTLVGMNSGISADRGFVVRAEQNLSQQRRGKKTSPAAETFWGRVSRTPPDAGAAGAMNDASTTMDFTKLPDSDVIAEQHLETFRAARAYFYQALVHLNVNIFVIERIFAFPITLFTTPERRVFFRYLVHNFGDMSILLVAKLASDNGRDVHTLIGLRQKIVRDYLKPEYVDNFRGVLRANKFTSKTHQLFAKAQERRNRRIAHLLLDDPAPQMSVDEVKELRDALIGLFNLLSFNIEYAFLPMPYLQLPNSSGSQMSDIDDMLYGLALTSGLLMLPEENPAQWQYRRKTLSATDTEAFNSYRRQVGLSTVE
jgi:hypothetical protein